MRKYRPSVYNYYYTNDKDFVIYNTLSGAIVQTSEKDFYSIKSGKLEKIDASSYLVSNIVRNINDPPEAQQVIEKYNQIYTSTELRLTILVTGQCNLRCTYCYEDFRNGKMSLHIADDVISYIKATVVNYKALYIEWFGGEPLMAIDVIEYLSDHIISFCRQNNIDYMAGITTNGTLLSLDRLEVLNKCLVRNYQITLDGDAKTHDSQRVGLNGCGSFDLIYKNLLMIQKSSGLFSLIIRINISSLYRLDSSFRDFLQKLYQNFGTDARFRIHFAAISDLSGKNTGSIDICDTSYLEEYYQEARKIGFNFSHYKSLLRPGQLLCYAANPHAFVINSIGAVHKCTVGLNYHSNNIGYLKNGKMILSNKEKLWNRNITDVPDSCKHCFFLPVCLGDFCPLERLQGNDFPCPPMKRNLDMYLRLLTSTGG